jgi:16S rRNA processing protein RimM
VSERSSDDDAITPAVDDAASVEQPTVRRRRERQVAPPPPIIAERGPAPERLVIGRIATPHGTRGELRMVIVASQPEGLRRLRTVYIGEEQRPYQVRRLHFIANGKEAILRLTVLTNPEDAAALRGERVWADLTALPALPENEYYHYQLLGLDVSDESGKLLGRLSEIIETGANDVYVVRGPGGEVLLPAIEGVILTVDLEAGTMTVRPQEFY